MQHLELLAPLRLFVVSKARKLTSWLWRGFKYAVKHPIKMTFGLLKLWLCLMLFTVFTTVVMAADEPNDLADIYLVSSPAPPKEEIKNQYVCGYGDVTPKTADNLYQACQGAWLQRAQESFDARTDICQAPDFQWNSSKPWILHQNFGMLDWKEDCIYKESSQNFSGSGAKSVGTIPEYSCPPDDFPNHTHKLQIGFNPQSQVWELQSSQPEKCYMEANPTEDKSCEGGVGEQAAQYSIEVSNEDYPNGGHPACLSRSGQVCEVVGGPWIEILQNEEKTVWSIGSGTFTGNECDPTGKHVADSPTEDKFCSAQKSNGVFQVDCPESSIGINWNQVDGLAEQSARDNARIAAIEATFIKQEDLTTLVNSGQLKGDKGDKGDKGEQGIQGVAGGKGATGEKGADGKDGIDGIDGVDGVDGEKGATGEAGADGKDGIDGEKGADGKDGIDGVDGVDGEKGATGEAGADGKDGIDGEKGADGKDGIDGVDGVDGEDGKSCSVIQTPDGASIACEDSMAQLKNGDSCTTVQLPNGDAQVTCEDGTTSEINGVDEDGIISALDTQLTEMKKHTTELEKQSESLKKLSEYDGDKPKLDFETKPDAYTEIAEFDWENNNFGTVMEEHIDAMKGLPLFSAIDNFFVTSFGGSCPVWQETVNVLGASFTVTIDQFCSSAVQNILPYIRAVLMLVAGFFAWRIAIE